MRSKELFPKVISAVAVGALMLSACSKHETKNAGPDSKVTVTTSPDQLIGPPVANSDSCDTIDKDIMLGESAYVEATRPGVGDAIISVTFAGEHDVQIAQGVIDEIKEENTHISAYEPVRFDPSSYDEQSGRHLAMDGMNGSYAYADIMPLDPFTVHVEGSFCAPTDGTEQV